MGRSWLLQRRIKGWKPNILGGFLSRPILYGPNLVQIVASWTYEGSYTWRRHARGGGIYMERNTHGGHTHERDMRTEGTYTRKTQYKLTIKYIGLVDLLENYKIPPYFSLDSYWQDGKEIHTERYSYQRTYTWKHIHAKKIHLEEYTHSKVHTR